MTLKINWILMGLCVVVLSSCASVSTSANTKAVVAPMSVAEKADPSVQVRTYRVKNPCALASMTPMSSVTTDVGSSVLPNCVSRPSTVVLLDSARFNTIVQVLAEMRGRGLKPASRSDLEPFSNDFPEVRIHTVLALADAEIQLGAVTTVFALSCRNHQCLKSQRAYTQVDGWRPEYSFAAVPDTTASK